MQLDRSIGLGLLTLYGIGVIVGAGIYVLIGAVAGVSGALMPLAFLVAGVVAAFSAGSFAELSARIPESAGEAAYVEEAFAAPLLSTLTGLGVVAVGVISAAVIVKGGVGYIAGFADLPRAPMEIAVLLLLGGIAALGVRQSLTVAGIVTVAEIAGLLVVAAAGLAAPAEMTVGEMLAAAGTAWDAAPVLLAGALLAFFAFVGFEDMVNMAEETVDPARTVPRAIFLAVAATTVLYCLVAVAALHAVGAARLAQSERPLALVFEAGTGMSDRPILVVAILATLNGALVQIVMVSRVLYGLGRRRRRWLGWFHALSPRTRTPVRATATGVAVIAALILSAPIATLAEWTSTVLLCVFVMVNAALIALKRRGPPPPGAPRMPMAVPVLAILFALGLLLA